MNSLPGAMDIQTESLELRQARGGYNPTLTIEALAWRAAKGIARRHGFTQS